MTFNNASFAQHSIASLNPELARLLHPGRFYDRPKDVLDDPDLSVSERRAILSSWASDACAVESVPALRHAPFARRPVPFDEIMNALAQLDRRARDRDRAGKGGKNKDRSIPLESRKEKFGTAPLRVPKSQTTSLAESGRLRGLLSLNVTHG